MRPRSFQQRKSLILAGSVMLCLSQVFAADVTLMPGTYTDTQSYDQGTISGEVVFGSGANYTFGGALLVPQAWNRLTLRDGASLSVAGTLTTDISGFSLNGGVLTTGGIQMQNFFYDWGGNYDDGKVSIPRGRSIVNGGRIVASQSNPNFIRFAPVAAFPGHSDDILYLGNNGATIDSNGAEIGVSLRLQDFTGQVGGLVKTGVGTLTLSAVNQYLGGTTVEQGTLVLANGDAGGTGRIRGALTVQSGATVETTGDATGFGWVGQLTSVNIQGGTVTTQGANHIWGISGGITMTGGTLQSNGGVSQVDGPQLEWNQTNLTTLASSETATIAGRIRMRSDNAYSGITFHVADGLAANDLHVSAAVTEASPGMGITKTGAGTMLMTGQTTYTGVTRVQAGRLVIGDGGNSTNLGDQATVQIDTGAVLDLNFFGSDTIGKLIINGVAVPSGRYDASTPGYGSFFAGTGSVEILGQDGVWTSIGGGEWSQSSHWQGGLIAEGSNQSATFSAGTGGESIEVTLADQRTIGALLFSNANYTLAGGSLNLAAATTPSISVAAGLTTRLATTIEGSQGFRKQGDGVLVLPNANTYTGGTALETGTLRLEAPDALANSTLNLSNNTTLQLRSDTSATFAGGDGLGGVGGASITIDVDQLTSGNRDQTLTFSPQGFNTWYTVINATGRNGYRLALGNITSGLDGDLTLNANSADVWIGQIGIDRPVSTLLIGGDANTTVTGAINATYGIVKSGNGTLTLNGLNRYPGHTTVNAGSLVLSDDAQLQFYVTESDSNRITGAGAVTLKGDIVIDTTAVSGASNLVRTLVASQASYDPTFTVVGFTPQPDGVTWTLSDAKGNWSFSEATGNLTFTKPAANDLEAWTVANGITGGPSGDDDGDGVNNFDEYAFGLDPKNPAAANPVTQTLNPANGTIRYQRRKASLTGLSYTVQTSTDLVTWTTDATADQSATDLPASDQESVVVTLSGNKPLTVSKLFVRVSATSAQ